MLSLADIQRLIIKQLFNIRQQEYYCATDELKCHNSSKYPPFSLTQMLKVATFTANICADSFCVKICCGV